MSKSLIIKDIIINSLDQILQKVQQQNIPNWKSSTCPYLGWYQDFCFLSIRFHLQFLAQEAADCIWWNAVLFWSREPNDSKEQWTQSHWCNLIEAPSAAMQEEKPKNVSPHVWFFATPKWEIWCCDCLSIPLFNRVLSPSSGYGTSCSSSILSSLLW